MREMDEMQEPLFTTEKLEDFVPADHDHPLRPVRLLVNQVLKRLDGLFGVIYVDGPVRRSRPRNRCEPCC